MGNEFVDLFDQWAASYDETVNGLDPEYKDVFLKYEDILQKIADASFGNVLEFGPGTGNLTKKLLDKGLTVTAVEPSSEMRKIARSRMKDRVQIIEGDFFNYPKDTIFHSIVSSYAFHHLTDSEKEQAIASYRAILPINGKIIFADTMYTSYEAYEQAIIDAQQKGSHRLAKDLQSEYYTTIPILIKIMEKNDFDVKLSRCNDFVWIIESTKR
jgi:putative AdoMet-dependent methyltransferase